MLAIIPVPIFAGDREAMVSIATGDILLGALRRAREDGFTDDRDVGAPIAKGGVFPALDDRALVDAVSVGPLGRRFGWRLDEQGHELDLRADATRTTLETQRVRAMADPDRQRPSAVE